MKKYLLTFCLFFIVFGLVYSQTITVTSPKSGDKYYRLGWCKISWIKNGPIPDSVKIRLLNSAKTQVIYTIKYGFDISNVSNLNWKIPTSVKAGNYIIRIKTMDNSIGGDSAVFEIKDPVKKKLNISLNIFQIVQPNSSSTWYKGFNWKIVWEKNGSGNDAVGIYLINYFKPVTIHEIKGNCQNDLNYTWHIPNTIADGKYRIKIVNKVSGAVGISKIFKIKSKLALKIVE
ncbi:MAG: Ser-Thr-rich GPI-anchored membrane family protein [Acidobacteriota bacterium]